VKTDAPRNTPDFEHSIKCMWFVYAAIIVEGSVIQITIACDVHCVAIVYKYNMFGFVVCAMRVRHEANQFNTYSRSLETKWLSVPESLFELGGGTNHVTHAYG